MDSNLNVILSHLKARHAAPTTLQAATTLADLSQSRVTLIQQRDDHLQQRNQASAQVGQYLRQNENSDDDKAHQQILLEQAKAVSQQASEDAARVEVKLLELQTQMDSLLNSLPNLLDDRVPDGVSDADNEVVLEWGDVTALSTRWQWPSTWQLAWHDDVATKLGGYQSEAAVKISGARFVALSGSVARLERALAMFMLDSHIARGYTEVSVPYIVSRSSLEGTGQLPKFEEDLFAIAPSSHTCNGEDAFLIPTAEVPVTNLHREELLAAADLPKKYVSYTPCFRAEAGSYGRDTKGLIRTHQFHKVELVKITTAETSDDEHEQLTQDAEAILQALELPYRKMRLCAGDIGFSARHCYDLEVWLPGAKEYREISSCSNCGDFQARRMNLRYRPAPAQAQADGDSSKNKNKTKKTKPQLCHTINGSGLAVGRTLVAVLENYQQPDGSVVIPDVLRPYMGGLEVIAVPTNSNNS
jgi:seryl-tRNA synthetase